MSITTILELCAVLALIALNGFFVAAEFSLISVRVTRIEQLAETGNRTARFIQHTKADPSRFLSASQTGITLASLALGWVGEPAVARVLLIGMHHADVLLGAWIVNIVATVVTFLFITYLHIVLGELVPKALALQRTESVVLMTASVMQLLVWLFTPFIVVLQRSTKWLVNQMGIEAVPEHHLAYSEEELKRIVSASHEVGILEAEEQQMLHKVFAFSDKVAREVMVPRPDMTALPVEISWVDLVRTVREHVHTRFPVYEENLDHILGVFHAKDLFRFLEEPSPEAFSLRALIREVPFVPENKPVDDLLAEFKKGRTQIAIVMDEYGGTAGLVTLEDLLEEIVGEIEDEFDVPEPETEMIGPTEYLIDGRYRIVDFNERFGGELPTEDFDTIAGLVFGQLGREPQMGDEVDIDGFHFVIRAMEGHRITRLFVRLAPEQTPHEDEDRDAD
ncbi:MAG TPA: hemolysin family protein [Oscillatoriaceae cyanobacterium]